MKNSAIVIIGAVIAISFIEATDKIGGLNMRGNYNNVPKGEFFPVYKIAEFAGVSEFEAVKALRKFLKQGKVWNYAGLYMFR
jgi:hypothetical protein